MSVLHNGLTINDGRLTAQPFGSADESRVAVAPVETVSGQNPNVSALKANLRPVAVVLDLVNTAPALRWGADEGRELRLDETKPQRARRKGVDHLIDAGTQLETQREPDSGRVEQHFKCPRREKPAPHGPGSSHAGELHLRLTAHDENNTENGQFPYVVTGRAIDGVLFSFSYTEMATKAPLELP